MKKLFLLIVLTGVLSKAQTNVHYFNNRFLKTTETDTLKTKSVFIIHDTAKGKEQNFVEIEYHNGELKFTEVVREKRTLLKIKTKKSKR